MLVLMETLEKASQASALLLAAPQGRQEAHGVQAQRGGASARSSASGAAERALHGAYVCICVYICIYIYICTHTYTYTYTYT